MSTGASWFIRIPNFLLIIYFEKKIYGVIFFKTLLELHEKKCHYIKFLKTNLKKKNINKKFGT